MLYYVQSNYYSHYKGKDNPQQFARIFLRFFQLFLTVNRHTSFTHAPVYDTCTIKGVRVFHAREILKTQHCSFWYWNLTRV